MKHRLWKLLFVLSLTGALMGCGKQDTEPEPEKEPEVVQEPEDTEPEVKEEGHEGMVRSYLTGEWVEEAVAAKRPYAIMIGNYSNALPQYGIGEAEVIYEAPAEGGIARMMAIFQDPSELEKIGSVRSCRHYFYYFAREFDAIYVHYGQAYLAESLLAREDVHNISGLDGSVESLAFFRDSSDHPAPDNAFASGEGLLKATEKKEYRTEYSDSYEGHFQFVEDGAAADMSGGEDAGVVEIGYYSQAPWFVYDEESGMYLRNQYGKAHIDGTTGEQLAVKNIIVQFCDGWVADDEHGYLEVDTMSSGKAGIGKYITDGKVIDITWSKASENSPARYFNEAGQEISINQGKTWVCVNLSDDQDRFHVYKDEAEFQSQED